MNKYKGKWKDEQIVNESFFTESISTSQNINPSYGYLWWLNGKVNYMVPGGQTVHTGPLVPSAPADTLLFLLPRPICMQQWEQKINVYM